jgi:hypothetical protein
MIYKLRKENKKSVEVVILKIDGHFLIKQEGKFGKPFSFNSTKNCGSSENIEMEVQNLLKEYYAKGFINDTSEIENVEFEVFDKAQWHLDNEYPKDLPTINAYTHTGYYLGWIILNKLTSKEFSNMHHEYILNFLNKNISSVQIYLNQLDGVFSSNDVNEIGYKFTKEYFDFESGNYLIDYENNLCFGLPTLFHIKDTFENFNIVCKFIDKRFEEFKQKQLYNIV